MTKNKTRVRIDWIADEGNNGDIEVMMDLEDFESSNTSIRKDIKYFKEQYLGAIKAAKEADPLNTAGKRGISTSDRWKACRTLANFNSIATNKFEITNYKEAYSRDFGLPMRSIRTYLDFGGNFSEDEIIDDIPYSIYAEIVFRINSLRSKGIFDDEKKWLIQAAKSGKLPTRNEYRERLKAL